MALTYSSIPGLVLAAARAKTGSDNPPPTSPAEGVGLLANRPAANTVTAGTKYFATDALTSLGGVQYISDGTNWIPLNNRVAGPWQNVVTAATLYTSLIVTAAGIFTSNIKIDSATGGAAGTAVRALNQSDYPSDSFEMRLSTAIETRETTPVGSVNITPGLYLVIPGNTSPANVMNIKAGSLVQAGAVFASPGAGVQIPSSDGGVFSPPATGFYTVALAIDAAFASGSVIYAVSQLQTRTKAAPA